MTDLLATIIFSATAFVVIHIFYRKSFFASPIEKKEEELKKELTEKRKQADETDLQTIVDSLDKRYSDSKSKRTGDN